MMLQKILEGLCRTLTAETALDVAIILRKVDLRAAAL